MAISPEVWKNPENATPEELLEMVLEQRADLKRTKKRAGLANARLADVESRLAMAKYTLWHASYFLAQGVKEGEVKLAARAGQYLEGARRRLWPPEKREGDDSGD